MSDGRGGGCGTATRNTTKKDRCWEMAGLGGTKLWYLGEYSEAFCEVLMLIMTLYLARFVQEAAIITFGIHDFG